MQRVGRRGRHLGQATLFDTQEKETTDDLTDEEQKLIKDAGFETATVEAMADGERKDLIQALRASTGQSVVNGDEASDVNMEEVNQSEENQTENSKHLYGLSTKRKAKTNRSRAAMEKRRKSSIISLRKWSPSKEFKDDKDQEHGQDNESFKTVKAETNGRKTDKHVLSDKQYQRPVVDTEKNTIEKGNIQAKEMPINITRVKKEKLNFSDSDDNDKDDHEDTEKSIRRVTQMKDDKTCNSKPLEETRGHSLFSQSGQSIKQKETSMKQNCELNICEDNPETACGR